MKKTVLLLGLSFALFSSCSMEEKQENNNDNSPRKEKIDPITNLLNNLIY